MSNFFNRNLDTSSVRSDLLSHDTSRQLKAVKQVIACMVTGKDMSSHYNDIANLLSSSDLQMKKLVYLYLMQNSRSQPEKAVLQAGTFVHDTNHSSPLIRGIALRTMSSMLVPAMVDFLHPPVLARLRDSDPYVRRNAAFACLKLFTIAPEVCKQTRLLEALEELLDSPTVSVVSSVVCVINELAVMPEAPSSLVVAVSVRALKLLEMLTNSASEWSQLYLLEGIGQLFQQKVPLVTLEEAESVACGVLHLFRSGNAAVVLAAAKIVFSMLMQYSNEVKAESELLFIGKIAQPFMSLVTTGSTEVRYVALRNLVLLLQAGPAYVSAFVAHLSHFFIKFDDPIYIKLEKIEVLLLLATADNAPRVLAELAVYATEADTDVIRNSVRGIGTLALRMQNITSECMGSLVGILSKIGVYGPDAVSETAIMLQSLLRQYPAESSKALTEFSLPRDSGESEVFNVIEMLCSALSVVTERSGRSAIVWTVGEYGGAESFGTLEEMLETFANESLVVQLSLLSAVTKSYLKFGSAGMYQKAFETVMARCKSSEVPDVRDRAYFYWRLVSADPQGALRVLAAQKAGMLVVETIERPLLVELLSQAGRLSSVMHKPAGELVGSSGWKYHHVGGDESSSESFGGSDDEKIDELNATRSSDREYAPAASSELSLDVLSIPWAQVLEAPSSGKGLDVQMGWTKGNAGPQLHTRFSLEPSATSSSIVKVTAMQINVNVFGVGITQAFPETVLKAGTPPTVVSVSVGANNQRKPVTDLQVALKVEPIGVLFFVAPPIPMHLVLQPATGCDPARYASEFEEAEIGWQLPADFPPIYTSNSRLNANALRLLSLNLVHSKDSGSLTGVHIFASTIAGQRLYAAVSCENNCIVTVTIKSDDTHVCTPFGEYLLASLSI